MFSNNIKYPRNSLYGMIAENRVSDLKISLESGEEFPESLSIANVVDGETLFHTAVKFNRVECLQLLLKHYPDPKKIEFSACYYSPNTAPQILTPLQIAIQKKNRECKELLIKFQYDQHASDYRLPEYKRYQGDKL